MMLLQRHRPRRYCLGRGPRHRSRPNQLPRRFRCGPESFGVARGCRVISHGISVVRIPRRQPHRSRPTPSDPIACTPPSAFRHEAHAPASAGTSRIALTALITFRHQQPWSNSPSVSARPRCLRHRMSTPDATCGWRCSLAPPAPATAPVLLAHLRSSPSAVRRVHWQSAASEAEGDIQHLPQRPFASNGAARALSATWWCQFDAVFFQPLR